MTDNKEDSLKPAAHLYIAPSNRAATVIGHNLKPGEHELYPASVVEKLQATIAEQAEKIEKLVALYDSYYAGSQKTITEQAGKLHTADTQCRLAIEADRRNVEKIKALQGDEYEAGYRAGMKEQAEKIAELEKTVQAYERIVGPMLTIKPLRKLER